MHTHTCMRTSMLVGMSVSLHMRMRAGTCVYCYVHACATAYSCVYVYASEVCEDLHMHVCIWLCIFICMRTDMCVRKCVRVRIHAHVHADSYVYVYVCAYAAVSVHVSHVYCMCMCTCMCVFICIVICMCICICGWMRMRARVCVCVRVCMCMCACMRIEYSYMCVCAHALEYTHVYLYEHVGARLCAPVYVCIRWISTCKRLCALPVYVNVYATYVWTLSCTEDLANTLLGSSACWLSNSWMHALCVSVYMTTTCFLHVWNKRFARVLQERCVWEAQRDCDRLCINASMLCRCSQCGPATTHTHVWALSKRCRCGRIVFFVTFNSGVAQWLAWFAHNPNVDGLKPRSATWSKTALGPCARMRCIHAKGRAARINGAGPG